MNLGGESRGQATKIVRLVGRLNLGGPTRQVLALGRELRGDGFETLLCIGAVEADEREFLDPFHAAKIPIERIPSLRRSIRPWSDLKALLQLRRVLLRERPAILHTHQAKAGAIGRIAGWLAGVPIRVHSFHGLNFEGHFGAFGSWVSRLAERRLAKLSSGLVAVSDSVRRDLIRDRIAPEEKIVVIPPGLGLEPFLAVAKRSGELRRRFSIGEEEDLIGFVGRLVPVKDPEEFLATAAAVSIARPQARFVVLGDGPLRSRLRSQAEGLGLEKKLFFAGWRTDMPECLSDLDLLVSTSRSEGMPLALIEAMAAGVPVVARAVGGVPELLDGGRLGELVPAGIDDGVEKAVIELLGSAPRRAERSREGRLWVRSRYGGERLASDTRRFYRSLLDGAGLA